MAFNARAKENAAASAAAAACCCNVTVAVRMSDVAADAPIGRPLVVSILSAAAAAWLVYSMVRFAMASKLFPGWR